MRDSPANFHQVYGEYYLDALCLGADTSTFLSTSSSIDLDAEMKSIQVKARLFGFSATVVDTHSATQAVDITYDVTFCGFDSLTDPGYQQTQRARDRDGFETIKRDAAVNVANGTGLDKRVKDVLSTLGVGMGVAARLTQGECEAFGRSGLVVELLFLPYAGLRDYIAATSIGSSTSLH